MRSAVGSSHKVFRIKYHFVLCAKYRKGLFRESRFVETVKATCRALEERYHVVFETVGFDEDHVHFMLQSVPSYSASKIFQLVKSVTARRLFEEHPDLKAGLWGGEFWSDGGYVGTVGEGVNAETIREYIRRQGRKVAQLRLLDF